MSAIIICYNITIAQKQPKQSKNESNFSGNFQSGQNLFHRLSSSFFSSSNVQGYKGYRYQVCFSSGLLEEAQASSRVIR